MLKRGEIEIHSEHPLTNFLCGPVPTIASKRNMPKVIQRQYENEKIDMSAFPAEIKGYRRHKAGGRSSSVIRTKRKTMDEKIPMTKYKKIKGEEDLMKKVNSDLGTYSDSHKRKTIQIHQDWEERYMKPFLGTMKNKLNGGEYKGFVSTRSRATTALGERQREKYSQSFELTSLLYDEEEVSALPYVKLPLTECEDRIHKYQRHAATEEKLARVVLLSQGINPDKPPLKERNTVDVKAWRLLPETRFYNPDQDPRLWRGRKPFREILNSTIDKQLDQF